MANPEHYFEFRVWKKSGKDVPEGSGLPGVLAFHLDGVYFDLEQAHEYVAESNAKTGRQYIHLVIPYSALESFLRNTIKTDDATVKLYMDDLRYENYEKFVNADKPELLMNPGEQWPVMAQ